MADVASDSSLAGAPLGIHSVVLSTNSCPVLVTAPRFSFAAGVKLTLNAALRATQVACARPGRIFGSLSFLSVGSSHMVECQLHAPGLSSQGGEPASEGRDRGKKTDAGDGKKDSLGCSLIT